MRTLKGWLTGLGAVVTVLLTSSCGGSPPLSSPIPRVGRCPAPVVRQPERIVPRRVLLVNATEDTVDIWIDRCMHHTRLATVPPGRSAQPRLPEPLVAFPGGLRFHAHRLRGVADYFGLFTVPLEEVPILEVVIDHGLRAEPDSLGRKTPPDSVGAKRPH